MKLLLLLLFTGFNFLLFAQKEEGQQWCKALSDRSFFGRGYVKGGDSLAAAYIAGEFKRLGVQPLGKSYFQSFDFRVNTFPTDIQLIINGKELELGKEYIPNEESGAFIGDWKFRIITVSELMHPEKLVTTRDSLMKKTYSGIVINACGLKGDTLDMANALSAFFIQHGNILKIVDKKENFSVVGAQYPYAFFVVQKEALPENITSIKSIIKPVLKQHKTQNVIGFIPAAKKNAPYLFFTAHYDHLGGIGNQVFFPGASDNASGVAMLLSMVDYYKKNPSDYNMVFIAFAGEEAGLLGSKYYVEHPVIPLSKIKFLINLDLMGNGEDGITVVNGSVFKKEFELLQSINNEKNYLPVIKSRGKAANSDHYFFTEKGVPSFFIYTMGKNLNYHDVFDVYEDLSFAKFNEIVWLLIDFVEKIE